MSIITVKNKFQIVIPAKIRKEAGLNVGDFLEAGVEKGKITLTPKSIVDREIETALEDFRAGRTSGPFETHEALVKHLKGAIRKYRTKKRL